MTPSTPGHSCRIDLGKIALHVTQYDGNGPRLLLLHGIGSNSEGWNPVIDDLALTFSPVTVDLRGHGCSDKPESGYLYTDYVSDIEGLFTALDWTSPLIVGHSLGGIIALWWATRHPDRARALVAEDSALRSGEDFRPAFDSWLRLNALPYEELVAYYAAENPEWSPDMVESRARAMAGTRRGVFQELRDDSLAHDGKDRISELKEITSPVLLVHGDYQTGGMVHPEDIEALPRRLPDARTIRIPGGGHTLHRSSKEKFLAATVPFLLAHA